MNQQTSNECPQPGVLIEFLQGKLHPPQLEQCESHLKDCTLCHETLVGLSSNDTLSERVAAALQNDEVQNFLDESSAETQNLLDRLTSDDFKRSSLAAGVSGQRTPTADAEVIADRAAEILRCVRPAEDSLGKLGDYTLLRLIGAGSTGVVFQAIDETLERTVALKVLRPSLGEISRNRFLVEAKLAASIEHVNVVTIFQVGQVDRLAFMAMPWQPGQTLESLLASGEKLDDNRIIEIICQVAAGLDAAHQKQLVHRDIKPANLWICEDDQLLKILDFGLARISDDNPNLTATGMLAGTPNFMSPEQTRGLELDGRSDLFSLGCVLYRLLTGKLPFGSPTVLATLSSIQSHTPVPPAELNQDTNQDLSDLTMCLLEKQPVNRPQSAPQTIVLLTTPRDQWPIAIPSYSSANVGGSEANESSVARPVTASSGRNWSSWIPAIVGLLLLGGFGWFLANQIIRISTPEGEVVIETSDENVEVEVRQEGKVVDVIDTKTQQSFSLKSGTYSFNAKATDGETSNSFTIEPKTLTMHRGDKVIVKVTVDQSKQAVVDPAASVASSPTPQVNKPIYEGRTFTLWLQAAKFDRAAGAKIAASLGCAKTAETDEEWAQFLNVAASLLVKKNQTSEDRKAVRSVLLAIDTQHLFGYLKSEIAQGKSESRLLFRSWLSTWFPYENPPSFPWEQINELTDVINQNSNKPGVLEFLGPILSKLSNIDGPEAEKYDAYLTKLQKSPAGKRILKLALKGDLQEKFDVFDLALHVFDGEEVRDAYKNDLLDPSLDNRSVMVNSISKPWSALKPTLIWDLFRNMDPVKWRSLDDNDVDVEAEAAYVSEASELLIKVTDGILKRELLFSESVGPKVAWSSGFLEVMNFVFFDVVQRTSDRNLKRRLLKSLEAVRASLAPESLDNDNKLKQCALDLDYMIASCKDFPPSHLPPNSELRRRKPRENHAVKVEKVDPVAETPKPVATIKEPVFAGKTFAQWLKAARFDVADGATAGAILGCVRTAKADKEWAQLLAVTTSHQMEVADGRGGRRNESRRAVEEVCQAVSADHLFDFVESEIVQGKTTSLRLFRGWFGERFKSRGRFKVSDRPPFPWKRINELTDLINQNADKPGGLEFLKAILRSMQSIDGPEARAYIVKLRNSRAGRHVHELALTGNLQQRYGVLELALRMFEDEAVREVYKRDLLDPKLNNRNIHSGRRSLPWAKISYVLLDEIFIAMDPEYWTWDHSNVDAAAEAKYVTEAADLLAKVADEMQVKQSFFSNQADGRILKTVHFENVILARFFDVAQRTSDENIKQRMRQKLEVVRELLEVRTTQDIQLQNDLNYVIAYYKGDPPAKLPRSSRLRKRKPKEKPVTQVEKADPSQGENLPPKISTQ